MYVFDRAIRKSYPEINFELRLLSDSLGHHFDVPPPVFRENTIPEGLQWHSALFRIEPKNVVYFGRSINELSTAHIPGPTARMTQMLGFGQIVLATSQLAFRFLRNRHIRHRPDKLDAAGRISCSTSHRMDVFH